MMARETVGTVLLMSFGARNNVLYLAEKLQTVVLIVGVARKIIAIQTKKHVLQIARRLQV